MPGNVGATDFSDLVPVDPAQGRRARVAEQLQAANELLSRHGAITDTKPYTQRWHARHRAQKLISMLVDDGHRQRWELVERTWTHDGAWRWAVELQPGGPDG